MLFRSFGESAMRYEDPQVTLDSPMLLSLSSGTTGMPKGPRVSQGKFIERFMVFWIDLGLSAADRFVTATPLYFGGGRAFAGGDRNPGLPRRRWQPAGADGQHRGCPHGWAIINRRRPRAAGRWRALCRQTRRTQPGIASHYLILASLNTTCLRATGSYFFSSSLLVCARAFFLVT